MSVKACAAYDQLQWGRASMSAERMRNFYGSWLWQGLQWGRASMSAESWKLTESQIPLRLGFNGAALR